MRFSQVTLNSVSLSTDDASIWNGSLAAFHHSCGKNRVVTVYAMRPGADPKIGSTKAKPDGGIAYKWTLKKAGWVGEYTDAYYAKVKASAKCKGDSSPTVLSH